MGAVDSYALGHFSVSRIGFGAMQLPGPGVWGPPRDRGEAVQVLRRAVELGVDHIDTAQYYGPGVANELIREALHPYPDTRAGQLHGAETDARDREITQSVAVHGTHTSGQRSFADLAEQAEEQCRTRRRQLAHRTLPSWNSAPRWIKAEAGGSEPARDLLANALAGAGDQCS